MSDVFIDLPGNEPAESIPALLAASKPKRVKAVKSADPILAPADETPAAESVSAPPAAVPAIITLEETIMATTIENVAQTATDKTQAMFADANDRAKTAMEKTTKLFEELNSFSKGNVEALVESGKIVAAGMQSMTQDGAAYVRKQAEDATTAARTLASVKSPTEFVKLQSDYVRQQFDAMVAETSRSTEAMLKLVGQVVQPISNRFAVAVEKIKQAA